MKKVSLLKVDWNKCYVCGSSHWIETHHIMGGANRKMSEKYGLLVPLCHYCHNEPPNGVHHNADNMNLLRRTAQCEFEKVWSHEKWMAIFGRSYL